VEKVPGQLFLKPSVITKTFTWQGVSGILKQRIVLKSTFLGEGATRGKTPLMWERKNVFRQERKAGRLNFSPGNPR